MSAQQTPAGFDGEVAQKIWVTLSRAKLSIDEIVFGNYTDSVNQALAKSFDDKPTKTGLVRASEKCMCKITLAPVSSGSKLSGLLGSLDEVKLKTRK